MTEKSSIQQIRKSIDFRIIALIGGLVALHQVGSMLEWDVSGVDPYDIVDPLIMGILSLTAFFVSKRYWGSDVFGKSYLALGIGFACLTVGDLIYVYYENIGIDPYPSIADAFFFAMYPFSLIHVIMNTRYFKRKFEISKKVWLVIVPVIITSVFTFVAYSEWGEYDELLFDLFYGIIFVAGASILLAFAVIGAAIFRQSILGAVWLLLALGIVMQSFADVWYYYIEIFEGYNISHPTNSLWTFSFLIMIYALYKHRKAI